MSHSPPLPDDLEGCHRLIREMAATLSEQSQRIEQLEQSVQVLVAKLYGAKSERHQPDQPTLFDLEEEPASEEPEPPPPSTPGKRRRRHAHGRGRLPEHLPRERIEHVLEGADLNCSCCGQTRQKISEVVSEQLEYEPASLRVLEHVRFTYACKSCEENVRTAPKPRQPIDKGMAGPGLLAALIVSKYSDHLPLYRLEEIFAREGVHLPRSTTCSWMAACADLLTPLHDLLRRCVLASRVIHTDDTPVRMRDEQAGMKTGRLWIHVGDALNPYTVFDFTPTRSRDGPMTFLKGFTGYLQADAYAVYRPLYAQGATYVACWAHCRRKFYEVRESDPVLTHEALARIRQLYALEAIIRESSDEEKATRRQQEAVPLLSSFREWLEARQRETLPKSGLGKAISYALSNWEGLCRYTEEGFLSIDNNISERGIRPIAVGRKNWLFVGSERGGKTASVLMGLIASCKQNGVDPFAYLKDVLQRIPDSEADELSRILPDRWLAEHPEAVWLRRREKAMCA